LLRRHKVIRLAVASFETALKLILWFGILRGVHLLGSFPYQLHLIALLIFHFLMVLSARLVCESEDAPSMVSFLPTPTTQAMYLDTLPSFYHREVFFPSRAFHSSLVQQKERNPTQRPLSLDYQEESVIAAKVCIHFIPQSAQFQKMAVQVIMEPRQLNCSALDGIHCGASELPQDNFPRKPLFLKWPSTRRRTNMTTNEEAWMSPSNFGSGTCCSFLSCDCGTNFSVNAGFTAGSFKKMSTLMRVDLENGLPQTLLFTLLTPLNCFDFHLVKEDSEFSDSGSLDSWHQKYVQFNCLEALATIREQRHTETKIYSEESHKTVTSQHNTHKITFSLALILPSHVPITSPPLPNTGYGSGCGLSCSKKGSSQQFFLVHYYGN
ncbi:hypothetical protein T07_8440, partial [Trichinella nelsoni]